MESNSPWRDPPEPATRADFAARVIAEMRAAGLQGEITHDEIAGMMGKTVSFSKSQLARAHQKLRHWLGEEAIA